MNQQQGYYQQGPPQQGYYQQGPPQQGYYQQGPPQQGYPQQQPVYVQQGQQKEESCLDSCLKCLCCCFLLELVCGD